MRRFTFLLGILLVPDVALNAADRPEDIFRMYRAPAGPPQSSLVIHEWGTFTSLQNENGDAVGGLNVDTELLPFFVHNFAPKLLPNGLGPVGKGIPSARPRLDVTMRLETPVVYFHLPTETPRPTTLDLAVRFRGGWLTQFFPDAQADIDGAEVNNQPLNPIPYFDGDSSSSERITTGGLTWRGFKVGTDAALPETNSRVWLAPRNVECDRVTTPGGETEQYLFYRGVGHLDAPLRVSYADGSEGSLLQIRSQMKPLPGAMIRRLWLLDVAPDGKLAFRAIGPLDLGARSKRVEVRSVFDEAEYTSQALAGLQNELREALVADGLYADEADALLTTWERSYFRETGLRLLFLVPREWTHAQLPMSVSVPADIRRSMVGRIELIGPRRRMALRKLAAIPADLPDREFLQRTVPLRRQLGRFAAALMLDEQRLRPTDNLRECIRRYGIGPVPATPPVPPAPTARLAGQ